MYGCGWMLVLCMWMDVIDIIILWMHIILDIMWMHIGHIIIAYCYSLYCTLEPSRWTRDNCGALGNHRVHGYRYRAEFRVYHRHRYCSSKISDPGTGTLATAFLFTKVCLMIISAD
jgi:hypothetical protein